MANLTTIGRCRDCHWFPLSPPGDFRLCVWHNGSRGTFAEIIRAGKKGTIPVYVSPDFGCVAWEKREVKGG